MNLESASPERDDLVALYRAVGWSAYADDPERLQLAVQNSTWVRTIWREGKLVGLCRALTDHVSICYLQDVLVHPDAQGQGLGKRLLQACLDAHADVTQFVLTTDDRPEQLALYRSVGLSRMADLKVHKLNSFLRIQGVELK